MGDKNQSNARSPIKKNKVNHALISGSLSSTVSVLLFQPLDVLKTRIQLFSKEGHTENKEKILGRSTRFARQLVKTDGFPSLWKGTSASLLRSIPGVGFYYSFLQILQQNFTASGDKPDNRRQAFLFGLTSRSAVSLVLLPASVMKVHYESGIVKQTSFIKTTKFILLKYGWLGTVPTVLRDSVFSGAYYMTYSELKARHVNGHGGSVDSFYNFLYGLASGTFASVITNPIDVIKTRMQVELSRRDSMWKIAQKLYKEQKIHAFYLGVGPRTLKRTLVAATTWTIYEYLMTNLSN